MKKDKHITINIDEWMHSVLLEISQDKNRNITNLCYLVIKDYINNEACKLGYINKEYERCID